MERIRNEEFSVINNCQVLSRGEEPCCFLSMGPHFLQLSGLYCIPVFAQPIVSLHQPKLASAATVPETDLHSVLHCEHPLVLNEV